MDHAHHTKQLHALKRIEGQIKGIQKMIEEGRYCVDILTQMDAAKAALARVQDKILESHLDMCVQRAVKGRSDAERQTKIDEIFLLLRNYRKR